MGATTSAPPAVRAQEEYDRAAIAFNQGEPAHAAFHLGAMGVRSGDRHRLEGHLMRT